MIQPDLINLHLNEFSQEFHYYPFAARLNRCLGSCNTLNDLYNKVCVPNKTEDLNLSVFNMDNTVISCDEIIGSYDQEKKQFQQILVKKCNLWNKKLIYFTCFFINYNCIIDSC